MPPNATDISNTESANTSQVPKDTSPYVAKTGSSSGNACAKASRSLTMLITQALIGVVTGILVLFAFRGGSIPVDATNQHIILCVVGFQFLMAQGILCLAPDSWMASLNVRHRRWMHWVLQVLGSALGLGGCIIKIMSKSTHFTTYHGQFALVAMVFTSLSLINGVTSMYAYELRRKISPLLSKLTHIIFGIIAMAAASVSLCYALDYFYFREWVTTHFADALIVITGTFTTIVIINPFFTFSKKSFSGFKK